jgi:hypothetical protein
MPSDVDEPSSPAPTFVGTNAATGVVIYYQLPDVKSDTLITLEILNSKNELVRSYSSKPDDGFVNYAGGPDADPQLPVRKGVNRFVWDLRGESIKGVPTVFIEGSYDGYKVAPGEYTAKLKMGDQVQTTKIRVKANPNINATDAEYAEQEALVKTICEEASSIHAEVLKNRRTISQLRETSSMLKERPGTESIREKADKLAKDLQAWEDDIVQNKAKSNDDIINYVNKITADYIFLKGEMDTNTPYVTQGQRQQYETLHGKWMALKERKASLEKEIVALNADIQKANIGRVIL